MKFQFIALAAFAGYVSATTYANFCNDENCSDGCGISVSVDNPGCLNESGRKSVSFHGSNIQEARLVFSPEQNCNCQQNCVQVVYAGEGQAGGPACMSLDGYKESQSFRFVGGAQCDANNC
ncbi:uncharacterized protein K489DRAFT_401585 [Dissoconium aciculare CBS 342.82]|uniref:Uncharacterized protein n=1 Tax=Dissoconium aciculare CBS 342.82 TaxID=1314786 RepID=A0A6J3M8A8_9PEZI|nr:uncharacterized protein K489DRAFT_401585 [Dissoconium aciculare CBS 342.82]KAF1823077.1 hypothetical protein K489DRAFT_401585 [Dissoconium aciculare CBS 342.82]